MLLSRCLGAVKIESQHLQLEALHLFLLKSPKAMSPCSVICFPCLCHSSQCTSHTHCAEVTGYRAQLNCSFLERAHKYLL